MKTFLDGKKTYLLGIAGVVYAILGYLLGHIDAQSALEMGWASLTAMTLRHSVAKK